MSGNPADKARPGVTVTDDPQDASKGGFVVESGVLPNGRLYLRLFFDGQRTAVVNEETGWTIVRLMAQALGVAEADALVYAAFKRLGDDKDGEGDELAASVLLMMRDERGRRDVSYENSHFYERITEGERTHDG